MKNLVNKEDRSELLGQVIDVFEDFLCEKNINIFNPNGDANIYGNDYDHMRQKLNETLVNWGLLEDDRPLAEYLFEVSINDQKCNGRKQQLIKAIDDAEAYIPSSDELEIDYFDDIEISGEHKSGWFACRYDGHSSTLLLEFSDQPLITDDEVLDFDINVADVCDELGIAYCG